MDFGVEGVGFLAATLTTCAFFPQVAKTWSSGSAEDISTLWLVMFGSGLFCWLIYGVMVNSYAVMAANVVTLMLLGVIAWIKWRP
ncbi:MAG: SemiSWEET transporter [Alphaproteobacteria bacterium]|nr:SemiSWEET transporter [Alphaproteobacteria bacterium]